MSRDKKKVVKENGVMIEVETAHDNPSNSRTFYNPVMQVCRELVLSALAVHVDRLTNGDKKVEEVKCLDAFAASGIAGLQWKHHLASKVSVTLNDFSPVCVEDIRNNCVLNNVSAIKPLENEAGSKRTVGSNSGSLTGQEGNPDLLSELSNIESPERETSKQRPSHATTSQPTPQLQAASHSQPSVEVVCGDANVLLHSRQHHFIHLDPFGTTAQFLEGAFRNVYNGGVVILTSTDIAALYGKCKEVLWRNYTARAVRCDYTKEMAVRIVTGAAARAAGRCNKGFVVLYGVVTEHFVQVAVKIQRGARQANNCLAHVKPVVQCQKCQRWAILPDTDNPIESPSSLLPCSCREENVKSLMLGPMWCGSIFDTEFIDGMRRHCARSSLSPRVVLLLTSVYEEAVCSRQPTCDERGIYSHSDTDVIRGGSTAGDAEKNVTENLAEQGQKRKLTSDVGADSSESLKKRKRDESPETTCEAAPMFYQVLQNRKLKNVNIPKLHKLVAMLRGNGFRASKTHFDNQGLRTDASLQQVTDILLKRQDRT